MTNIVEYFQPPRPPGIFRSSGLPESPIEQMLYAELIRVAPPELEALPQVVIGRYRVDFVIGQCLVIECDGRANHSSWEQQARDHVRDIELQGLGLTVWRLTGDQIVNDYVYWVRRILHYFGVDTDRHDPPMAA